MAGRRVACVVANGTYDHPELQRLRSPASDAEALVEVLGDSDVAGFEVSVISDGAAHEVMAAIEDRLSDARPDDLVLLHFSGHGLKDESGALFLAARNTRPDRLGSTAVPADFIQRAMNVCRARRMVLLLDCCYGGAFGRGVRVRASGSANVMEAFPAERMGGGRGRAVISASSSMEFAFEGDRLAEGKQPPSVFTHAVVTGLRTGAADLDGDGLITLDELYDYVFDEVRSTNPRQSPTRRMDLEGDVVLATSVRGSRQIPVSVSPTESEVAGAGTKDPGPLFLTAGVLSGFAVLLTVAVLLLPVMFDDSMWQRAQNLLPVTIVMLVLCLTGAVSQCVAASRPSWRSAAAGLGGAAAAAAVLLATTGWWIETTAQAHHEMAMSLRQFAALPAVLSAYLVTRAGVDLDLGRWRTRSGAAMTVAGALGGAGAIVVFTAVQGDSYREVVPVYSLLVAAALAVTVPPLSAVVGDSGHALRLGWAGVLLAVILENVLLSDLAPGDPVTAFTREVSDDLLTTGLALLLASLLILLVTSLLEQVIRHVRRD